MERKSGRSFDISDTLTLIVDVCFISEHAVDIQNFGQRTGFCIRSQSLKFLRALYSNS